MSLEPPPPSLNLGHRKDLFCPGTKRPGLGGERKQDQEKRQGQDALQTHGGWGEGGGERETEIGRESKRGRGRGIETEGSSYALQSEVRTPGTVHHLRDRYASGL